MKNRLKSYKELIVWKKSLDLVTEVYQLTKDFPKDELYGLTSQMRRSAVAIPSNIAEGYQRNYIKEYIQFLYIAKSSTSELETQIIIVKRLQWIPLEKIILIEKLLEEILKMLSSIISKLKNKSYSSITTTPYTLTPTP